ncbi:hypothetical protein [Mesorhizobium sp. LNHC209A00]|uniref:hypothetical protein n=1 Tax=Mesorhizobium TaxID=68287 RepID=UPI0018DBB5DF|nr:hypothetical protein [Mesorhizobium sp. LNHC209A00]
MKRVLIILILPYMSVSSAMATCNKDTDVAQNCMDEATDALKTILNTNDDSEKSKSAGEAAGNCIRCASEALSDQMHQLQPSGDDAQGN